VLEVRQGGHGATQPLPFLSAWDLIISLGKATLGACLCGAAERESLSPSTLVSCQALRTIPIQHPGSLLQLQPCPVYLQLWTDGSTTPGVGAGAGFVTYVNIQLHASEVHPAGLKSSDFRVETVPMSFSLTALTTLKDSYSYSSIRIFTDCQILISTLSRGTARQPDSVCTSIWLHLSSISKISSIHVQWIPAHVGIPGNKLVDLKAKQGSTLPQISVPIDLSTAKVLIQRTGQEEFHARYIRDPHSTTHHTLTGETNTRAH